MSQPAARLGWRTMNLPDGTTADGVQDAGAPEHVLYFQRELCVGYRRMPGCRFQE